MSLIGYNESGYIDLIKDVLANGVETPDRTGVGCIKVFDRKLIYDVKKRFPFSTIRPAPLRMAFEEFWMFMRGEIQTNYLVEKDIYFWKGNTSREFLDKRGLTWLPEGSMGYAYGAQFRNFGGRSNGDGVDQLVDTYNTLLTDPFSRRMLTTFWNPKQSHLMALTPCWHSHLFNVMPEKDGSRTLNMKLTNRSLDCVFGHSFAIQQYALYLICMAKISGMNVGIISCDLTDVHIYLNQIEYAKEMVKRDFGTPGTVEITKKLVDLRDVIDLTWEDIDITGLKVNKTPFKNERPPMAV